MVRRQTGRDAELLELKLKLHLVGWNQFPTDAASRSAAGPAEREVRPACRQFLTPNRLSGFLSEEKSRPALAGTITGNGGCQKKQIGECTPQIPEGCQSARVSSETPNMKNSNTAPLA
jgi:hypothetical protein